MLQIAGIYTALVIVMAVIGLQDEPSLSRREGLAILAAALLWPLFHVPWRGSGKHRRRYAHAVVA